MSSPPDYASIASQLLTCDPRNPPVFPAATLHAVAANALRVLKDQPPFLPLQAPLIICGDIHGQLHDLQRIFRIKGMPPESRYLFMGDYVDRGDKSVEVTLALLALKAQFPNHVFLLRGNHECSNTNDHYGFREECAQYAGEGNTPDDTLWTIFNRVFQWLPLCASVNGRIFCVHGGLSPELKSLDQLDAIDRSTLATVPDSGLVCDLLWSDPDRNETGWGENDRGCSHTFGPKIVEDFCNQHGFDLVCRAHQVMDGGYEFFCKRKLATVFSAANYCGDQGNRGSIMSVDKRLKCNLIILLPNDDEQSHELRLGSSTGSSVASSASSARAGDAMKDELCDELGSIFQSQLGVGGEVGIDRAVSPPPTSRAPSPRVGMLGMQVME